MTANPPPIRRVILALPAYNEAAVLEELLAQAEASLSGMGLEWNIIVVDDGSADETAAIAERASAREPRIQLARHGVNRGLGPAILTGLTKGLELAAAPEATMLVCMDADLTHSPTVIPSMQDAMNAGADLVIASRYHPESRQEGLSAFRTLLSWGARRVFDLALGLEGVRDYTCGFRAIRASLVKSGMDRFGSEGLIQRRGFACTDELLVKLALLNPEIREVPFTLRYDLKQGKSKIKLGVTIAETLRLVAWARRELRAARRARR